MCAVIPRTDQSFFLAEIRDERNRPPRLHWGRRDRTGDLDQCRYATRIIVCSVVDRIVSYRPGFISPTYVVVMRSHQNIGITQPWMAAPHNADYVA